MNCKPGDMAVVVKSCWESCVGMVVEVVSHSVRLEASPGVFTWACKLVTGTKAIKHHEDGYCCGITYLMPGEFVGIADCCLKPIKPPPVTVNVTTELNEKA